MYVQYTRIMQWYDDRIDHLMRITFCILSRVEQRPNMQTKHLIIDPFPCISKYFLTAIERLTNIHTTVPTLSRADLHTHSGSKTTSITFDIFRNFRSKTQQCPSKSREISFRFNETVARQLLVLKYLGQIPAVSDRNDRRPVIHDTKSARVRFNVAARVNCLPRVSGFTRDRPCTRPCVHVTTQDT